jgi:hypothetical protein
MTDLTNTAPRTQRGPSPVNVKSSVASAMSMQDLGNFERDTVDKDAYRFGIDSIRSPVSSTFAPDDKKQLVNTDTSAAPEIKVADVTPNRTHTAPLDSLDRNRLRVITGADNKRLSTERINKNKHSNIDDKDTSISAPMVAAGVPESNQI